MNGMGLYCIGRYSTYPNYNKTPEHRGNYNTNPRVFLLFHFYLPVKMVRKEADGPD